MEVRRRTVKRLGVDEMEGTRRISPSIFRALSVLWTQLLEPTKWTEDELADMALEELTDRKDESFVDRRFAWMEYQQITPLKKPTRSAAIRRFGAVIHVQ